MNKKSIMSILVIGTIMVSTLTNNIVVQASSNYYLENTKTLAYSDNDSQGKTLTITKGLSNYETLTFKGTSLTFSISPKQSYTGNMNVKIYEGNLLGKVVANKTISLSNGVSNICNGVSIKSGKTYYIKYTLDSSAPAQIIVGRGAISY